MGDEEDILRSLIPRNASKRSKRPNAAPTSCRAAEARGARPRRGALQLSLLYERSVFEGKRALWLSSLYCDPDVEAMKVTIATGVSDSIVAK